MKKNNKTIVSFLSIAFFSICSLKLQAQSSSLPTLPTPVPAPAQSTAPVNKVEVVDLTGGGPMNPKRSEVSVSALVNNFSLAVAGGTKYTRLFEYNWINEGKKATINFAGKVRDGGLKLTITDQLGTELYSSELTSDVATFVTPEGKGGRWKIVLDVKELNGTFSLNIAKAE